MDLGGDNINTCACTHIHIHMHTHTHMPSAHTHRHAHNSNTHTHTCTRTRTHTNARMVLTHPPTPVPTPSPTHQHARPYKSVLTGARTHTHTDTQLCKDWGTCIFFALRLLRYSSAGAWRCGGGGWGGAGCGLRGAKPPHTVTGRGVVGLLGLWLCACVAPIGTGQVLCEVEASNLQSLYYINAGGQVNNDAMGVPRGHVAV